MDFKIPTNSFDTVLSMTGLYISDFYQFAGIAIALIFGFWIVEEIIMTIYDRKQHFGTSGSLSDTSTVDDSYKLKEKLYETKDQADYKTWLEKNQ